MALLVCDIIDGRLNSLADSSCCTEPPSVMSQAMQAMSMPMRTSKLQGL